MEVIPMRTRSYLLRLGAFLAAAQIACGNAHATEEREFAEMFDKILLNLRTNYWDPSGNIKGDSMYDGPAFAPYLLLNWGKDRGDAELTRRGFKVVDYELSLLKKLPKSLAQDLLNGRVSPQTQELFIETSSGAPGLVDGFDHKAKWEYASALATLVPLVRAVVYQIDTTGDNPMCERLGCLTILGASAVFSFRTADVAWGSLEYRAEAVGTYALDVLEKYWSPAAGAYQLRENEDLSAFEHGAILMALAWGYGHTGKEEYRTRFDRVLQTMEQMFNVEVGGYRDYLRGDDGLYLASNLSISNSLLVMYAHTGNGSYLDRARAILSFIQSKLFYPDIYELRNPNYWIAHHHWSEEEGMAHDHCTGSNYFLLGNIYLLNALIAGDGPSGLPVGR